MYTLRGTPESAYLQPEPNATELPSCAPISARAAQRRRRRRWWRGEEGARRPGPKGKFLRRVLLHVLRHVPRHVLRHILHVLVLYVSPRGRHACVGRGFRRWKITMGKMSTATSPPSAAPKKIFATSFAKALHVISRKCWWENQLPI